VEDSVVISNEKKWHTERTVHCERIWTEDREFSEHDPTWGYGHSPPTTPAWIMGAFDRRLLLDTDMALGNLEYPDLWSMDPILMVPTKAMVVVQRYWDRELDETVGGQVQLGHNPHRLIVELQRSGTLGREYSIPNAPKFYFTVSLWECCEKSCIQSAVSDDTNPNNNTSDDIAPNNTASNTTTADNTTPEDMTWEVVNFEQPQILDCCGCSNGHTPDTRRQIEPEPILSPELNPFSLEYLSSEKHQMCSEFHRAKYADTRPLRHVEFGLQRKWDRGETGLERLAYEHSLDGAHLAVILCFFNDRFHITTELNLSP
jgi:hypothetical protein